MNQQRVEVVEVAACIEEGPVYASYLRVAAQEDVTERVEEADEGQLDLRVRVVQGRVEEGGDTVPLRQHVGTPHVAVYERRGIGVPDQVVQPFGEPLHPAHVLHGQPARLVGDARHVE